MCYPHHFLTYLLCNLYFLLFMLYSNLRSFLVATKCTSLFWGFHFGRYPLWGLSPQQACRRRQASFAKAWGPRGDACRSPNFRQRKIKIKLCLIMLERLLTSFVKSVTSHSILKFLLFSVCIYEYSLSEEDIWLGTTFS